MAGVAYAFASRRLSGTDACVLSGPGGACEVLPGIGSQLASLRLTPGAGEPLEVLWAPPADQLRQAGWGGGAPILFPFPGRVAGGQYGYRGVQHRIRSSHGRHPLHGFVGLAPWQLDDGGADGSGAWVRTAVEHHDLAVPAQAFPGDYRLEVTHRIGPAGYRQEICVTNTGTAPFPFGYGWHPYFRTPLTAAGQRAQCTLRLAAAARWELTADLLPTGRRLEVAGSYDLRQPSALADKSFDDPFTLLTPEADGWSRAELGDPAAGLVLSVRADPSFPHWVVYGPRALGATCLEPYTCAPDAYNLEARGIAAGLRELQPGERWRGALEVQLALRSERPALPTGR